MIVFVSKSEADCRTLREVAGLLSQSVVSCVDVQEARKAIRHYDPRIVVCEGQMQESGNWQELLEEVQSAQRQDIKVPEVKDFCPELRAVRRRVAATGYEVARVHSLPLTLARRAACPVVAT